MKNKFFRYEKRENTGKYSMPKGHIHRSNEIYYLARGVRRYFIDGEIFNIRSGDVVFIPKNTIHYTTSLSDANYERYLLSFSDDYIPAQMQEHFIRILSSRHFSLSRTEQDEMLTLLKKIRIAQERKDEYTDTLCLAYMSELLVMLSYAKKARNSSLNTKTQTEQTVADAIQHLHLHLSESLTLGSVADAFHLSHPYFSRIFKASTGLGFNTYLTHLRIQQAAELLLSTSLNIAEISERCGFTDSNYFSTVFKKIMGTPPKKYRTL